MKLFKVKITETLEEVCEEKANSIEEAIEMMNNNDIVVLAGKGHEPYQEINGEKLPFDERIIVKEILKEKK